MKTLGLDVGGTKIAAAVVKDGKILAKEQIPTPQEGLESVLRALESVSKQLLLDHDVLAIGIGLPGPIDFAKGAVRFTANIAGLDNAPIVELLQQRLGIKVVLENDANAAGFAEHKYGAAKNLNSSLFITISTGIGGGLYFKDTIIRGANGTAGEIGHTTVMPHGPLCGCGQLGCWEALASGKAIAKEASFSYGQTLTTQEIFTRAKAGERKALMVVDNAAYFTGIGLCNLQKIFDPDVFVIGGGISQVGAFYLDKVQAYADRFNQGFPRVNCKVVELGTDAGVIGAAAVALL
jgi:glucokinase